MAGNNTLVRDLSLFAGLFVLIGIIMLTLGPAYGLRLSVEAFAFALMALGLTIQWGFGGLFNVGVMGFVAIGGFGAMLFSFPVNQDFWASSGPGHLAGVILRIVVGGALIYGAWRLRRMKIPRALTNLIFVVVLAAVYLNVSGALDQAAKAIESEAVFIGGFGMPVFVGWAIGGLFAGLIGWVIGHICLGLRSDYLAIATIGIAEIIKAFLKNADWLTKGTLTVSPLPWPVPLPEDVGFVAARSGYLVVEIIMVILVYLLVQRAYAAPWGRMMRAIRDNETAAEAMGKDVKRRRIELFVVGCVFIGLGGAALITFNRIFDPQGFLPLNHTFAVWVMVILGGAGNARGAIFGAILVVILWSMSESLTLILFDQTATYLAGIFGFEPPADMTSRALSMRVFIIGLAIILVLRFAPKGVMPEEVPHHK